MMDARRWQSPAVAAAAAEAAEEDAYGGQTGGPSRRPPRRGLHRASPYGLGPRRWLPKLPLASRIFPSGSRDHTVPSDNHRSDQCEPLEMHEGKSVERHTNAANAAPTHANNKVNLLLEGDDRNQNDGSLGDDRNQNDGSLGDDRNQNDGSLFPEIEKIIKQNHFSRYETERLIEIMRSRTPDLCVENQRGIEATPFSNKFLTPAKPVDVWSSWGTDILAASNVHDVSSSPIELAKAYMEAQTSATVYESQRKKFRALSHGVTENSASNFFPKVAVDSPVRWPGSVVQDYPNYRTPQTNKGRIMPLSSSHTHYTGSVFSRSTKNTRHLDTYNKSSGRSQLSTPFAVGHKGVLEDKMASTGAILEVQPSNSSEGVCADAVGATTPLFPRDGAATKNLTFNLQRPHGKGTIESGSTLGHVSFVDNMPKCVAVSVHPKSSETALKILQHLDQTIPSPAAKSLEMRKISAKRTAPAAVYKVPDSVTNSPRQSNIIERGSADQTILDAKKVQEPLGLSSYKVEESGLKIQSQGASQGANQEAAGMTSSRHSLKTGLTPLPTAKVLDKSTNNGFAFTFPVTKTTASLPEPPPTPTFSSPPERSLPANTEDIPKFTFRSSSSTNNLVWSFDSESGCAGAGETVPTFKFGTDKKRELSFNIAGKDAVCF